MNIFNLILSVKKEGRKGLAVLIDPDNFDPTSIDRLLVHQDQLPIDFFLVGGSLLVNDHLQEAVQYLKAKTKSPVILFPGSGYQLTDEADAVLFLSLISGRNPELLIGQHIHAAPRIQAMQLETIPTGYILVDSGKTTSAHYMSNSLPIPHDKPDIAACTAMAGEMLGLKLIYLEGGSGAKNSISTEMITAVKNSISVPLIVGGGIRDVETAQKIYDAGADIIVIGTAFEKATHNKLITQILNMINSK